MIRPEDLGGDDLAVDICEAVNAVPNISDEERLRAARAAMALRLSPSLKQVTFLERKGKLYVYITFLGELSIMERVPEIEDIEVQVVLQSDQFSYKDGVVHHEFDPFAHDATEENLRGGYVRLRYRNGRVRYHFVSRDKILKSRDCALHRRVWDSWFHEMCMKTIVRDAFSRGVVPLTYDIVRVFRLEDELFENDPARPMNGGNRGNGGNGNVGGVKTRDYVRELLLAADRKTLGKVVNDVAKDKAVSRDVLEEVRRVSVAKTELFGIGRDLLREIELATDWRVLMAIWFDLPRLEIKNKDIVVKYLDRKADQLLPEDIYDALELMETPDEVGFYGSYLKRKGVAEHEIEEVRKYYRVVKEASLPEARG